jgi:hypothetical protein
VNRFRFVKATYHKVHKELKIAKQNLEALQQEVHTWHPVMEIKLSVKTSWYSKVQVILRICCCQFD